MTDRELLVVYKPDGLRTNCTGDQARRITTAWASVVRWLQGIDPDDLPESDLVEHVARKAALRRPRYPEFDLGLWMEHARYLDHPPEFGHNDDCTIDVVATELLESLGLRRTHKMQSWLNRVAIELLYAGAASFQAHRDVLVPRLLDGPVLIERWTGARLELAQAIKFLIRRVLSVHAITNLVHMETATSADASAVLQAVEVPVADPG